MARRKNPRGDEGRRRRERGARGGDPGDLEAFVREVMRRADPSAYFHELRGAGVGWTEATQRAYRMLRDVGLGHTDAMTTLWRSLEAADELPQVDVDAGDWIVFGDGPIPDRELVHATFHDEEPRHRWPLRLPSRERSWVEAFVASTPAATGYQLEPQTWTQRMGQAYDELSRQVAGPNTFTFFHRVPPSEDSDFGDSYRWSPLPRDARGGMATWAVFGRAGGGIMLGRQRPESVAKKYEAVRAVAAERGLDVEIHQGEPAYVATAHRRAAQDRLVLEVQPKGPRGPLCEWRDMGVQCRAPDVVGQRVDRASGVAVMVCSRHDREGQRRGLWTMEQENPPRTYAAWIAMSPPGWQATSWRDSPPQARLVAVSTQGPLEHCQDFARGFNERELARPLVSRTGSRAWVVVLDARVGRSGDDVAISAPPTHQ